MYFKYVSPGGVYVASQWMQIAFTTGGFGATAYLNFDTANIILGASGASIISSSITDAGNGWMRVTATANATTTSASGVQVYFANSGTSPRGDATYSDAVSPLSIGVWGCQLEAGAFATSYIPTTTAAVTRNADNASVTSVTWYNLTEGTLYAEALCNAIASPAALQYVATINDATLTNRITIARNLASTAMLGRVNASSPQAPTTAVNGIVSKTALAYAAGANNIPMAVNGTLGSPVATAASLPASVTRMNIGASEAGNASYLNGWIRNINYYNTRLPNVTLQSITT